MGKLWMKAVGTCCCAVLLVCLLSAAAGAEPSHCPYDIHLSIMYNYLSDAERTLYDRLYDALWTGQGSVPVPAGVTKARAEWMLDYIYNEAPELCAYDRWASRVTTASGGMTIIPVYKMSIREQERFIRDTADKARRYAKLGEKKGLRTLHDDLSARFAYGSVDGEDTQLAYFALKNGKAVCNGYAQTFVMYAHFAGFTASYIDGKVYDDSGNYAGNHAWNIACADGRFFWLDPTWDDQGSRASHQWYDVDGSTMLKTHRPDPEYQPILSLAAVLPDRVTFTMHLDVNNGSGFARGITDKSGQTVRLRSLASGEYYTPAMVIWNSSRRAVRVTVSCRLDGQWIRWNACEVQADSNIAFRTNADRLRGVTGSHEIVWYCGGIRLGAFTWQVK